VRLYPDDIQALADAAPVGTQVRIIDAPFKVTWNAGALYLEAHPPLEGEPNLQLLDRLIADATKGRNVVVDWARAEQMARDSLGMPGPISAQKLTASKL
jgi:L,D-transpeptidase ErfK/SrfK